jgi:hypothetical protein
VSPGAFTPGLGSSHRRGANIFNWNNVVSLSNNPNNLNNNNNNNNNSNINNNNNNNNN